MLISAVNGSPAPGSAWPARWSRWEGGCGSFPCSLARPRFPAQDPLFDPLRRRDNKALFPRISADLGTEIN